MRNRLYAYDIIYNLRNQVGMFKNGYKNLQDVPKESFFIENSISHTARIKQHICDDAEKKGYLYE